MSALLSKTRTYITTRPKSWWIITGVVLVAALAVPTAFQKNDSGREATPSSSQESCEQSMIDQLKSPASARFGPAQVRQRGDEWIVAGSVDSQNSFGAMLRTNYVCTVNSNGFVVDLQTS